MKLTVSYARAARELAAADQLTKSRYSNDFGVDLAAIKESSAHQYAQDVLVISNQMQEIVATLTMMYPENGILFPTEDLFGMDIQAHVPDLANKHLVEVGRVAKVADAGDGELLMNTLMLTTAEYLRLHRLDGWIATVKRPMLRFLRKKNLRNITLMEHSADCLPVVNADVRTYLQGNDVFYFMAPSDETLTAFGPLYGLVKDGTVTLNFA